MCKIALLYKFNEKEFDKNLGYFLFFFLNTNLKKSVGAEQFYKVYSRTSGYTFLTVFSVNNQLIKHTNLHTASVSNGPTKI